MRQQNTFLLPEELIFVTGDESKKLFINKVVLYGRLFYLQIAANLPD
jgi:hypothetical protein